MTSADDYAGTERRESWGLHRRSIDITDTQPDALQVRGYLNPGVGYCSSPLSVRPVRRPWPPTIHFARRTPFRDWLGKPEQRLSWRILATAGRDISAQKETLMTLMMKSFIIITLIIGLFDGLGTAYGQDTSRDAIPKVRGGANFCVESKGEQALQCEYQTMEACQDDIKTSNLLCVANPHSND
ncbi:MAG: hypothetical protein WA728_15440 [Xanthobacteraceae bacterium]